MTEEVKNNEESQQEAVPETEESRDQMQDSPDQDTKGSKDDPSDDLPQSVEKQLAAVREQLLRKAADFENYKKRTGSEIQTIVRLANENLVMSILPIVDDLERSLKMGKSTEDVTSFHTGVEMIYQKLQKVLDGHGVTALETTGKPFDVHYHDAMMQIPKGDVEPDTILEEVEKGYSMNGKVIRHAKVVVSAPLPTSSGDDDAAEEKGSHE
jgi:molecular chaperone GrpE